MNKPIIIHVNRLYHIPLDRIIKIKETKRGKVYVYYYDENRQIQIAIAKQDLGTLLHIVNSYQILRGKPLFLMIKEK